MEYPINWTTVFDLVERACSAYSPEATRVQGDLLTDLRIHGLQVGKARFGRWTTNKTLRPQHPPGVGYPEYNLIEIKKAHLAAYLFRTWGYKPQGIKLATAIYESLQWRESRPLSMGDFNQAERAHLILSGRILAVCASLLTNRDRPPEDTILIAHRLLPADGRMGCVVRETEPSDILALLDPDVNLLGWRAQGPLDEVLSVSRNPALIENRLRDHRVFTVAIPLPSEENCLGLSLGVLASSAIAESLLDSTRSRKPILAASSRDHLLIAELLDFGISHVTQLSDSLRRLPTRSRLPPDASLLNLLVTFVLLRRPDRWSSAAFYAHTGNGVLQCWNHSPGYPAEQYPLQYFPPDSGGPFRWAFSHRSHIVVNRPLLGDFRLSKELAGMSAHAFVPAVQLRDAVGVLHVLGSVGEVNATQCFSDSDVEVLYVLARVIGEAFHRSLVASVRDLRRVVPLPVVFTGDESDLRAKLESVIADYDLVPRRTGAVAQSSERHLALFAIRSERIGGQEQQRAFFEIVQRRAYECVRRLATGSDRHALDQHSFRLGENELAVVINDVTDDEIRDTREALQQELDGLGRIGSEPSAQCAVWSVRFSYDYLRTNFRIGAEPTGDPSLGVRIQQILAAVNDIVSRTKAAIRVIWQVRRADVALRQRNYREAEGELRKAIVLDENNSYIWRHLAEALSGRERYQEAEEAAIRAIAIDGKVGVRYPSNHQRLSEAYFGQKRFTEALVQMAEACSISQDIRYRRSLIEMLVLDEDQKSLTRALELIIETETQIGHDDSENRAWLEYLRGEALIRRDKLDQALEAFEKAARLSPAYHDVNWDILRIRTAKQRREILDAP